jgi:RimJ/RimL family protein N-acetyltransferase
MDFEPIQTDRLILRRVRLDDAGPIHAYRSIPEVAQFSPVERNTVEETRRFLEPLVTAEPFSPGSWLALAITLRESGLLIGDIGLRFPEKEDYQVELGISLHPTYHRRGYASESMLALIGYAFEALKKHRVFASIDPRNTASVALVERIGMRREAHHLASMPWKGGWADDLIYAMLEREWIARNQP